MARSHFSILISYRTAGSPSTKLHETGIVILSTLLLDEEKANIWDSLVTLNKCFGTVN